MPDMTGEDKILRVENLVNVFDLPHGGKVQAVSDVSFDLQRGETLALVGESGCGKSTLGRAVLQLPRPTSGRIFFEGIDLAHLDREELRRARRGLQMVFQDPISSLNPRRKVGDIVAEPLLVWGEIPLPQVRGRVERMLEFVGLDATDVWHRRPHEFSGGQCQRISLARAMILEPRLLVCDEPVSALDVSVQAQILNLLHDMRARYQLTMLFISHDLAVVRNIADRVAVMYLGKIVEIGSTEEIFARPRHHYTRALLASVLVPGAALPEVEMLSGELPSALDPPSGCRFRTRCQAATSRCAELEPQLENTHGGTLVACHFPLN